MHRLLVIDDEGDVCQVVSLTLEAVGGWQVTTAKSGPEGIALAQGLVPDGIVLDVQMPGMDGIATFHELQKTEALRHVPVILLTAKVQQFDRRRFEGLATAGVLSKPFDPMTLPKQVAGLFGWSEPPEPLQPNLAQDRVEARSSEMLQRPARSNPSFLWRLVNATQKCCLDCPRDDKV